MVDRSRPPTHTEFAQIIAADLCTQIARWLAVTRLQDGAPIPLSLPFQDGRGRDSCCVFHPHPATTEFSRSEDRHNVELIRARVPHNNDLFLFDCLLQEQRFGDAQCGFRVYAAELSHTVLWFDIVTQHDRAIGVGSNTLQRQRQAVVIIQIAV